MAKKTTTLDPQVTATGFLMVLMFIGICICLSVSASLAVFLFTRKREQPIIVNAAPVPAASPVVIHKAAPKKKKKEDKTTGGTSGLESTGDLNKPTEGKDDEDPGLGV
ncbi:unnamed protein product [Caenorhabditis brenneri]